VADDLHPSLDTPEKAAERLVGDTLVHLIRKPGVLSVVRVSHPPHFDAEVFKGLLLNAYSERGQDAVRIFLARREGDPRLLSVAID